MLNEIRLGIITLTAVACLSACTQEREQRIVKASNGRQLAALALAGDLKEGPVNLFLPGGGLKSGHYHLGLKTGVWVRTGPSGDTLSMTRYVNGKAHGLWQFFSHGRRTGLALYEHGTEQGPRITWAHDGIPASIVRFTDGKEQGIAHWWGAKDTVNVGLHLVGFFVDGKPEGAWRRYYADGVLCNENLYRDGLRHGIWTLWARDGSILRQAEFVNDRNVRTIVDRVK